MIPACDRELYRAAEEKEWKSCLDYNSRQVLNLETSGEREARQSLAGQICS